MSNRGGGGGGGGGQGGRGGETKVSIPETVRKTIQTIREITGKQHSDEDIYTVLKDCNMDPNETAQKLLYLDTFHEVRRKRDRRKETSGTQRQGARSFRGNYSNRSYPDAIGGRNTSSRKENGVNHKTDRGFLTSATVPVKTNNTAALPVTNASSAVPNGPSSLPNGSSSFGHDAHLPLDDVVNVTEDSLAVDVSLPSAAGASASDHQTFSSIVAAKQGKVVSSLNKIATLAPASVSGIYSSASDPILAPSVTCNPTAVSTIQLEVGGQQKAAEQSFIQEEKHVPDDVASELPDIKNSGSEAVSSSNIEKGPCKQKSTKKNQLSEPQKPASLTTHLEVVSSGNGKVEASSPSLLQQSLRNGHVTFPDHLRVPEALKSGLTFGSFDTNSSGGGKTSGNDSRQTEESIAEPSSNQIVLSNGQDDQSNPPQQVLENVAQTEGNVIPNGDVKVDQLAQEMLLLPENHHNPIAQIASNYGLGLMAAMQGGQVVQVDSQDTQGENSKTSSSPSPTLAQTSMSAAPQHFLFRSPFPPGIYPFGPFFNPYLLPPMQQFLGHNGIPQQPSNGNAYVTPPVSSATGVKTFPQVKPGTTAGNPTPLAFPHLYGSYGSSFNLGPAVTSGSSVNNEDLSASQVKESHAYSAGLLKELSAWIPSLGQDISSLQLSYLAPQGQQLAFSPSQTGQSPFTGIYSPLQAMAAPTTVNPTLQLSQAMPAAGETTGPPSAAFQQPQLAQINWNSSF